MNQLIRAGAIIVAIFSSVGFAAAQNASSGTPGMARADPARNHRSAARF